MSLRHRLRQIQVLFVNLGCLLLLVSMTLVFGAPPSSFSSTGPANPQAKITATSALVVLPVNVTDSNHAFVPGLKAKHFRVFEDGREQPITLFKEEDSPVTVGLIVDHSRSMGAKLAAVTLAVNAFAHSSNSQDEMFVVDFNENVSVQLMGGKAFTHDAVELQKAIYAVSANGQTALYDAVIEGLIHIELGQWEKKALIIVSDGGDNASHAKFSELLARAQRAHVMIYSIGLVDEKGEEENPKVLERLSRATGGMTFFTKRSEQAAKFTMQIARDLREQYVLGYAPPATNSSDSFRKVSVQVSSPDAGKLHVRTRPGYFPRETNPQTTASGGDLP